MHFSSFTYLVRQGLHSLRVNRLMTFASMGVLTVCMVLIGMAFLVGTNIDSMVDYIGEQNETIVYVNFYLSDEETAAVDTAIRETPGVVSVTYVSPDDVLSTYSDMLGSDDLLAAFKDDNPFHANYRVVLEDVGETAAISEKLGQIPGVYKVSALLELSKTFVSIQNIVNTASYGLVAVLALVSMVIVNNTIRITVFARRKEIGIMKLVGATNGFIRFPFFVEGVASGWISAAIASGIVCGAYYGACQWYINNPNIISRLFSPELVPLQSVWYYIVPGFFVLGFVLCGIGTATSIRKHLDV